MAAVIFLDVAAYAAIGAQTITPGVTPTGTALVLYDPGFSDASTKVAQQVTTDLKTQNYAVTLAGIKSSSAVTTTDYDIIVIGGPIYAGAQPLQLKMH